MIVPILIAAPNGTDTEPPAGDPTAEPVFQAVLVGALRAAEGKEGQEPPGEPSQPDAPPPEETSRETPSGEEAVGPEEGVPVPPAQPFPAASGGMAVLPTPEAPPSAASGTRAVRGFPEAEPPRGGARGPGQAAKVPRSREPDGTEPAPRHPLVGTKPTPERPGPGADARPSPPRGAPRVAPRDVLARVASAGRGREGHAEASGSRQEAEGVPSLPAPAEVARRVARAVPSVSSAETGRSPEAGPRPDGAGAPEGAPAGRDVPAGDSAAGDAGTSGEKARALGPGPGFKGKRVQAPESRGRSGEGGETRKAGEPPATASRRTPEPLPDGPGPDRTEGGRVGTVPASTEPTRPSPGPGPHPDPAAGVPSGEGEPGPSPSGPGPDRTQGGRVGTVPASTEPTRPPPGPGPHPEPGGTEDRPAQAPADASPPIRPREAPPHGPVQARSHPAVFHTLERVQWAWSRGMERVTVRLFPPTLGRVEVTLQRRRDGLAARLRVETPEALRVLGDGMTALRQGLEARGVEVLHVVVDLRDPGEDGRRQQTGRRSHHTRAHAARRATDPGGDALAAPADPPGEARALDVTI